MYTLIMGLITADCFMPLEGKQVRVRDARHSVTSESDAPVVRPSSGLVLCDPSMTSILAVWITKLFREALT